MLNFLFVERKINNKQNGGNRMQIRRAATKLQNIFP